MKPTISRIHAFSDNYIWLIHGLTTQSEKQVIIVDPGDHIPVLQYIKQHQLQPQAIFITHHHTDHSGGVNGILTHFDIPVYAPKNENIDQVTHTCVENDVLNFEQMGLSFKIIDVPGHTRGHIAFLGQQQLFIGDTLFAGGCGRVFEGTNTQMQQSLAKLLQLTDGTDVYCAHEYTQENLNFAIRVEPNNTALIERIATVKQLRLTQQATVPSLLKTEKETNPFLRFNKPEVITAAENYCGHQLSTPAEVFAVIRNWKDDID